MDWSGMRYWWERDCYIPPTFNSQTPHNPPSQARSQARTVSSLERLAKSYFPHWFGTNPLLKLAQSKCNKFHSRIWISKCRLQNGDHFVLISKCSSSAISLFPKVPVQWVVIADSWYPRGGGGGGGGAHGQMLHWYLPGFSRKNGSRYVPSELDRNTHWPFDKMIRGFFFKMYPLDKNSCFILHAYLWMGGRDYWMAFSVLLWFCQWSVLLRKLTQLT